MGDLVKAWVVQKSFWLISSSILALLGLTFFLNTDAASSQLGQLVSVLPDKLTFSGHVINRANAGGACAASWLASMPEGSIILGANPNSCNPSDWNGGTASGEIILPDVYAPTVYVMTLSWPDKESKGLHSPYKNREADIYFDGQLLWSKRTVEPIIANEYYAAAHEPIKTTVVVKQSGKHSLRITVPANTAWDLASITFTAYAYPKSVRGIGYSPFRDCQYPGGMELPTSKNIEEDLYRLINTSNAIRTYASTGINQKVPAIANSLGLPVYAGAWIDQKPNDDTEVQALINLAKTNKLAGVIVGNEFYLRNNAKGEKKDEINYLLQYINQVKQALKGLGIPLMTAEIESIQFDFKDINDFNPQINSLYRPILDQVDMVMVHIYPFWTSLPIDGAAEFTVKRYKAIQQLIEHEYPGQNKRVVIGETGWPSSGEPQDKAVPSPENQRRFMLEFMTLAEQAGVDYMYFDTFDELWKVEEPGRVGQNWGYSYTDRSAKHPFWGILLPAGELGYSAITAPPPVSFLNKNTNLAISNQLATAKNKPLNIYTEWLAETATFIPSGYMGDIDSINMYSCDRSDPHSGEMAVRASFNPDGMLGWAGVYWQNPENNWGTLKGGVDLSWANKVTFWAKGAIGGEKVQFFAGGIGSDADPYNDSLRQPRTTGFIELTNTWQQYTIELQNADLSRVVGGFGWTTNKCASPQGATFFLDDIKYEYDPAVSMILPPPNVFSIYTDSNARENHFYASGWMGDGATPGQLSFSECSTNNSYRGLTSIKVSYTPGKLGWSGIYWQEPADNWGDTNGGYDLSKATRLSFWARSDTPGAKITVLVGGIGYQTTDMGETDCSKPIKPHPDSLCPPIKQEVSLSSNWQKYTVDVEFSNRDMYKLIGGFGWTANQPITFYLDDIIYELKTSNQLILPENVNCFSETAYCTSGGIRSYWEQNGGLPVFGFPVTTTHFETNSDTKLSYVTQWFERNRFEYHPENQSPYDILLGRLGDEQLKIKRIDWQKEPKDSGPQNNCIWFVETHLNVCDQVAGMGFKSYWQSHGLEFDGKPGASYQESLALFGYPLTQPKVEINSSGDKVLTQWFERARFEWHPDKPAQFKVLLGLLGNESTRQAKN